MGHPPPEGETIHRSLLPGKEVSSPPRTAGRGCLSYRGKEGPRRNVFTPSHPIRTEVLLEGSTGGGGAGSREERDPYDGTPREVSSRGSLRVLASSAVAPRVLCDDAWGFLLEMVRTFRPRWQEVLSFRARFSDAVRSGQRPDFLRETEEIRRSSWTVRASPAELRDRRVEITGPVDRKMVIHALNSGARVYMADFEDAHSPTWTGTLRGQENLFDAVRRQIDFEAADGRRLTLKSRIAVLMVRPRGWHLREKHVLVDNDPIPASLFDTALFLHANAREQIRRGTGPYLYLPKLEHYGEARLWNDVLAWAEERLGLPPNSVRVTVLIETLPAAFEMDEILWELRERALGLNCGRWDYIFSVLKVFHHDRNWVLPDRAGLTMDRPFLRAYARLLIRTCHRRRAHAMGGMAAQIPIAGDPEANARALDLVRQDKEREVREGHDGTWVAHPGLVGVAMEVFDRHMPGENQIERPDSFGDLRAEDLLEAPSGPVTREGVRTNVRAALRYLDGWFRGRGAVAIDHRMEDVATAEISRSQLWQWVHANVPLRDGGSVDAELFRQLMSEEFRDLRPGDPQGQGGSLLSIRARRLLEDVVLDSGFTEFLIARAYEELGEEGGQPE